MRCTYLTTNKIQLFNSLKAYFNYVLNCELISYDALPNISQDKTLVFILKEEIDALELMAPLNETRKLSFIRMGYDKSCLINLLDPLNLKEKFLSILENEFNEGSPLFTKKELIVKVKKFFKDHGEQSLIDSFNDVRYRLLNGIKLFLGNGLSFEESKKDFLIPGLKSWLNFKQRLGKYKIYLELLGFQKEIQEISGYILTCEQFIVKTSSFLDSGILEYNENYLYVNIDLFKKINEVLYYISTHLEVVDAGL
ncbi:MAG: hypothetical protein P4L35_04400 [Ignavibacteriaceae bacterium]|nr:hypothetical protein [Ignavibacteriaceae bacterium]